jgi:hypothetical protein
VHLYLRLALRMSPRTCSCVRLCDRRSDQPDRPSARCLRAALRGSLRPNGPLRLLVRRMGACVVLSADADQPRRSTASRLPLRLARFLKAALHAANGRRLHVRRAAGRTRFGLTRSTGWSSDNETPRPSSQQLQFRLRLHIETPQLIFTQTRLGQQ